MSEFAQAKKTAADFSGLLKVLEAVGKMDSLEETERQLNGRIGTAKSRLDGLNRDIEAAEKRRSKAVHDAASAEVELDEQAAKIVAKAEVRARDIVAQAEARANAADEATAAKHEEFSRLVSDAKRAQEQMDKISAAKAELRERL